MFIGCFCFKAVVKFMKDSSGKRGIPMGEAMLIEKSSFPDVVVRIEKQKYAINSRYISSIINMQDYKPIPGVAKSILGVMNFRGKAVPLLDMRILFDLPTIKQEYEAFQSMIDTRKEDHIKWVEKLEESIDTGRKFTLATDPHQCAFGMWFYHFDTDSVAVKHHLNKIEEPHRKLHELALDLERCKEADTEEKRQDCLDHVGKTAREKYMTDIIELLDETKEVFQSLYTEMLLVLEAGGKQIAIVIDEVLSVEDLVQVNYDQYNFQYLDYICGVKQQKNAQELILELDDEKLLGSGELLMDERQTYEFSMST